jgi:hypothetical protein
MCRCSVLLHWFDVGPTSYAIVCVLSFIWAWHMRVRTLCWSERNILSYIRTHTQNDSWIPDKLICIFSFHSFPLCVMTMSRKCRMFPYKLSPHIPWYFCPSAHRQLYFCVMFCHCAVWCTDSAVGLWSFRSTVYTGNYEFKQISSPRISMLKFYEYVMRSLLFKYVDHKLEYFSLSLEKF